MTTATGERGTLRPTEFAYLTLSGTAQEFLRAEARRNSDWETEVSRQRLKSGGRNPLKIKLPANSAGMQMLVGDAGSSLKSLLAGRISDFTLYNGEMIHAVRRFAPVAVEIENQLSASAILSLTADPVFCDLAAIFTTGGNFTLTADYLFLPGAGETGLLGIELFDRKKSTAGSF